MWHLLNNVTGSDKNEISADIQVPSDSPWFSGHFPGEPILPGVAQIRMVFDTICSARNGEMSVSSVRRVRFKQIIRPDDQIKIIASPLVQNDDAYSFRLVVKDETVCSGVMTVEQHNNQFEREEKNQDVNGNRG